MYSFRYVAPSLPKNSYIPSIHPIPFMYVPNLLCLIDFIFKTYPKQTISPTLKFTFPPPNISHLLLSKFTILSKIVRFFYKNLQVMYNVHKDPTNQIYNFVMNYVYKLGEPMEHIYWQRRVLIIIMELHLNQGIDVY